MIRCLNFICHFGKSIKLEVYFFSFLFTRKRKVAIFLTQTYSSSFNIRQSGRIVCKFRRQKNVINLTDYVFAVPPVSPLLSGILSMTFFRPRSRTSGFKNSESGVSLKSPTTAKAFLRKLFPLNLFLKVLPPFSPDSSFSCQHLFSACLLLHIWT